MHHADVEADVPPAWLLGCDRHGRHYTRRKRDPFPIALSLLLFALLCASAEEFPTPTVTPIPMPSPSPSPLRSVRISFVPPPIEGTISLGIYDQSGKVVRVLDRESATNDFTIGHDALITEWDGKNDAGQDLPAGKYSAHGYMVGALAIEGVDYFFNDWVTDENSLRVRHVWDVFTKNNELYVNVDLVPDEKATLVCDPHTGAIQRQLPLEMMVKCDDGPPVPNTTTVEDCEPGKDGSLWVIDNVGNGLSEIKQISKDHEILRHLGFKKEDPRPLSIAALTIEDRIFLVEQTANNSINRVRALSLAATKSDDVGGTVSDWKVDFEKAIAAHKDFSLENGIPVATGGKPTSEKVALRLQPNPLKRDKPGSVEVAVGFDEDGSYLRTIDGLPLRTISDTPNLSRALLVLHGEKAIDVFQDDGAVVEQYRISGADQMMAFDCGSFELK